MLVSRKQRELAHTCEITLNTYHFSNILVFESEIIIKRFLQICIHLYGTRRRVAVVLLLFYDQVVNDLCISMVDRKRWRRAQTSFAYYDEQMPSSWLRVSDFFDGGEVRGGKTGWRLGMSEDTDIATWGSDEERRLPRDVRRTRGRQPKVIDCLGRSCEPCLHDQVWERTTVASEKDVVGSRVRDLDVWSFESAKRWTGISFC